MRASQYRNKHIVSSGPDVAPLPKKKKKKSAVAGLEPGAKKKSVQISFRTYGQNRLQLNHWAGRALENENKPWYIKASSGLGRLSSCTHLKPIFCSSLSTIARTTSWRELRAYAERVGPRALDDLPDSETAQDVLVTSGLERLMGYKKSINVSGGTPLLDSSRPRPKRFDGEGIGLKMIRTEEGRDGLLARAVQKGQQDSYPPVLVSALPPLSARKSSRLSRRHKYLRIMSDSSCHAAAGVARSPESSNNNTSHPLQLQQLCPLLCRKRPE